MMHHNSSYISGWCDKAGINDLKFGPMGWMRLKLEQIRMPGLDIPAHSVFINMDLKADDAVRVANNRETFNKIIEGGFITLFDVTLDSYVKRSETTVNRRLKSSVTKFLISKEPSPPLNLCSFAGKLIQHPSDEWAEIYCSHRPGPMADSKDPWPTRSVKVYLPGGNNKIKIGHEYFIAGKVSGRSPAGKEDLIVIASVVATGD